MFPGPCHPYTWSGRSVRASWGSCMPHTCLEISLIRWPKEPLSLSKQLMADMSVFGCCPLPHMRPHRTIRPQLHLCHRASLVQLSETPCQPYSEPRLAHNEARLQFRRLSLTLTSTPRLIEDPHRIGPNPRRSLHPSS